MAQIEEVEVGDLEWRNDLSLLFGEGHSVWSVRRLVQIQLPRASVGKDMVNAPSTLR